MLDAHRQSLAASQRDSKTLTQSVWQGRDNWPIHWRMRYEMRFELKISQRSFLRLSLLSKTVNDIGVLVHRRFQEKENDSQLSLKS